jgi:hypothetical protein
MLTPISISAYATTPSASFGGGNGPKVITRTGHVHRRRWGVGPQSSRGNKIPTQGYCLDDGLDVGVDHQFKCLQCFAVDTRLLRILLAGREQGAVQQRSSSRFCIAPTSSLRSSSYDLYRHLCCPRRNPISRTPSCASNKSGRMNATAGSMWPLELIESCVNV